MRLNRLAVLTVSTLLFASGLQACSEDSDSSRGASEPDSTSTSTSTTERDEDGVLDDGSGDKQRSCEVKVDVSGAADATWKMRGESVQPASGSPAAYYTAQKKDRMVQVFSAGGDIATSSAVISIDGITYTTNPDDSAGVEASEEGISATVDAQADSAEGDSVDLVADFTCGGSEKPRKKSKTN